MVPICIIKMFLSQRRALLLSICLTTEKLCSTMFEVADIDDETVFKMLSFYDRFPDVE